MDGRSSQQDHPNMATDLRLVHTQTAQSPRLMDLAASSNNMMITEKNVDSHCVGENTISPSFKETNDQSKSDIQHIIALRKRSMMKKMRLKSQSQ